MFCRSCGTPIAEGEKFCRACGAPIAESAAPTYTERVSRDADGTYRWVHSVSLFKNPTFFRLIWKIFFFIILGIFAFIIIIDAVEWDGFSSERTLESLKFMGYILAGMTALVGISYLIYAAIMGGKYTVEFEMNEKGILHRQISSQAKKARRIGQASAVIGAAAGNLSTVGVGLNAQRTEMYSEFSKVRKVKACPRRDLIMVNNLFNHNQIYTAKEDFEFVKDYIISHCENLKK